MHEGVIDFDRRPFCPTPAPGILQWTAHHKHLLEAVHTSVRRSFPVVLLLGRSGIGKTTLVDRLLGTAPPDLAVGHLPDAAGDRVSIAAVRAAFGLAAEAASPEAAWHGLRDALEARKRAGCDVLLVVDGAERAPDPAFETLQRLAELTSGATPLLTQVLVARPELGARLRQARFAAFAARCGVVFEIEPLSLEETGSYVRLRLEAVGDDPETFDDAALAAIHARSGGLPRAINALCDRCLSAAHRDGAPQVDGPLAEATIATARGLARPAANSGRPVGLSEFRAAGPARPATDRVEAQHAAASGMFRMDPDDFVFFSAGQAPAPAAPPGLWGLAERPGELWQAITARSLAAADGTRPARPRARGRPVVPSALGAVSGTGRAGAGAGPAIASASRWRRAAIGGALTAAAGVAVVLAWSGGDLLRPGSGPPAAVAPSGAAASVAFDRPPVEMPVRAVREARAPDLGGGEPVPAAAPVPAGMPSPAARAVAVANLAPADPEGADRLFRRALDVGPDDPSAAALAFARAAIRGHARAAYFLGQMYETGDGVTLDPALARAWYAMAGDLVWARRRLGELPAPSGGTRPGAPSPVFAARSDAGAAELVWSGSPGGAPAGYLVELAVAPEDGAVLARAVSASAVRLDTPPADVRWWRVASRAADGEGTPSEWQRLAAGDAPP